MELAVPIIKNKGSWHPQRDSVGPNFDIEIKVDQLILHNSTTFA